MSMILNYLATGKGRDTGWPADNSNGCSNFKVDSRQIPLLRASIYTISPELLLRTDARLLNQMPIPDYQTLMLPVLKAASRSEVRISSVVDLLADEFGFTATERGELLPSGKQTSFSNRVHWAKSYLSKAQLVELTRRAHFTITARGRVVLQANPPQIDVRFLNQFEEFRQFRERSTQPEEDGNRAVSPSQSSSRSRLRTRL
jgi:hypothetical protein